MRGRTTGIAGKPRPAPALERGLAHTSDAGGIVVSISSTYSKLDKYKKAIQLLDVENTIFIIYDTAYAGDSLRIMQNYYGLYVRPGVDLTAFWDIWQSLSDK